MKDQTVFVYVDWNGKTSLVGKLFARNRKGRESASFEYDNSWLEKPTRSSTR